MGILRDLGLHNSVFRTPVGSVSVPMLGRAFDEASFELAV